MLPAEGMEPVHGMDIEEVYEKLRSYLGKLRGQKARDFWGIIHLGKKLKAGADIEDWRDAWARRLLIDLRTPDIGPLILEDDNEASLVVAANYEEF